jgi:poly(3-hydroxybutyrate) depolymerase
MIRRFLCVAWIAVIGLSASELHQDPVPQKSSQKSVLADVGRWLQLSPSKRAAEIPVHEMTQKTAERVVQVIVAALTEEARSERKGELASKPVSKGGDVKELVVKAASKEMRVLERTIGKAPKDGHSLWISMHGGGGAPAKVNDQQWRNQIGLYTPVEGIYVAPRAPTNTWNLWHEGHIDDLFDRLITNYIIDRGVNPDRVYLMGYSAGGDGVYQLAPRMADRFAAASMMAGHPNGVSVLSLRNLPFMIWMGAKDSAYKRNEMAATWGKKLDVLARADKGGYEHETHIVKGKGHWMQLEDAAAVPWMAKHNRVAWPKKVVWQQTGRTHDRFYWLSVPPGVAKNGQLITATISGQTVDVKTDNVSELRLRLSDALLDLDKEITIKKNGTLVFRGHLSRTIDAIYASLNERLDPQGVATAIYELVE